MMKLITGFILAIVVVVACVVVFISNNKKKAGKIVNDLQDSTK